MWRLPRRYRAVLRAILVACATVNAFAVAIAHAAASAPPTVRRNAYLVVISSVGPLPPRHFASVTFKTGFPRPATREEFAEIKPGYTPIIAGVCGDAASARRVVSRLRRDGAADAYLRRIRTSASPSCPTPDADWLRHEALIEAARWDRIRQVTALIAAGADVNYVAASGATALGAASLRGNVEVVDLLLRAGARADLRGPGVLDETPLMAAASSHDAAARLPIMRLLVAGGADVNAQTEGAESNRGTSPLTNALAACDAKAVRFLLDRGAKVVIYREGLCGIDKRSPAIQEMLDAARLDGR